MSKKPDKMKTPLPKEQVKDYQDKFKGRKSGTHEDKRRKEKYKENHQD